MTSLPPPPSDDALTDEQLDQIFVGGRPRLTGRIEVADYDPEWPNLFERECRRIADILGPTALSIEHVGSTSVPGLAAKPIIDIDLAVPNSADESAYLPALEANGYVLVIREPDWEQHRVLKGPDTNVNLHVWSPASDEPARHLLFRDWLRTHADDRELYQRTKQDVAQHDWQYVSEYNDAKAPVIREIYARIYESRETGT